MKALMYPVYGDPVDFENISSLVPDMSVIAHALALQNRWHGNTKYYWSVANHCIHAVVTDFSNTLGIYYSDVDHIVHTVDKLCGWAEVHAIANEKCPLYNFVEDVLPDWVLNDALLRLWNIITDCDTPAYSEIRYKTMFSGLNRAVIDAVEDKR